MIEENDILYNTCIELSKEHQSAMNEFVIYVINNYIDYAIKGNDLEDCNLREDNILDMAKIYFNYSLELMFSGVYPYTYQILMQNYYESKMLSLYKVKDTNIDIIRLQMLFVLYGSKLLHSGRKEEFLEVSNQFVSNKLFDLDYYKSIFIEK